MYYSDNKRYFTLSFFFLWNPWNTYGNAGALLEHDLETNYYEVKEISAVREKWRIWGNVQGWLSEEPVRNPNTELSQWERILSSKHLVYNFKEKMISFTINNLTYPWYLLNINSCLRFGSDCFNSAISYNLHKNVKLVLDFWSTWRHR